MSEANQTQVLIARIQDGDREAQDELCKYYLTRVYSAVRFRLGARLREKVQSCDIVQQAMLDVVKGAQAFECRSEGRFLNWVNRAIENRIRDEADRWQAQKRDVKKEIAIERASSSGKKIEVADQRGSPTPSLIAVRQEELELLERAMDLLGQRSEEYQELIIAVQLEGRTYSEISEETGKSPDAIRMQAKRAQIELAKIYRAIENGD